MITVRSVSNTSQPQAVNKLEHPGVEVTPPNEHQERTTLTARDGSILIVDYTNHSAILRNSIFGALMAEEWGPDQYGFVVYETDPA